MVEALKRNNQNVGGNIIQKASQQYLVRGIGLLRNVDDIRLIVLRSEAGVPILIRDVAEVVTGTAVRQGASVMNGEKEVVGGIAMMLRGANSREVVRLIEDKVADINGSRVLPQGLRIGTLLQEVGYRQAERPHRVRSPFRGRSFRHLRPLSFPEDLPGAR